jgi:hypothetical protein
VFGVQETGQHVGAMQYATQHTPSSHGSAHAPMIKFIRICFSDGAPNRSLPVAIVVGTVLNLINSATR